MRGSFRFQVVVFCSCSYPGPVDLQASQPYPSRNNASEFQETMLKPPAT